MIYFFYCIGTRKGRGAKSLFQDPEDYIALKPGGINMDLDEMYYYKND